MSDQNRVLLLGCVGRDPEVRYTASGVKILTLSVGTNRFHRKDGEAEPTKMTGWHQVKFIGRLADKAEKRVKKGALIRVDGELQTRSYVKSGDAADDKRYVTEVVARELQVLGDGGQPSDEDNDLNLALMLGRVGQDPDVFVTADGVKIVTISLATNRYRREEGAAEATQETEWHRVKLFGRLADVAEKYVTKGKQIRIAGEVRTRSYTREDAPDDKRYATEIVANDLQLLGGGAEDRTPAPSESAAPSSRAPAPPSDMDEFDDGFGSEALPF